VSPRLLLKAAVDHERQPDNGLGEQMITRAVAGEPVGSTITVG
jgi:hypothetical protein